MNILFLCLVLITCSFIFSASEIALFSLSRFQLKQIKDQSDALFRRIRTLMQDSFGLLITVLFFNELLNIAIGSLITSHFIEPLHFDTVTQFFLGIILITPITLICCELTPKVVATRANRMVVSIFLPVIYTCYLITRPLVTVIKVFMPKQQVKELHHLQEDDFIILAEEHAETGHLHETELELIKNVFEMDDTRVEQLATPMKKIITVASTTTVEQAAQTLLKDKIFSRVPVYGNSRDDIVGVILTKDLVEIKVNPEIGKESIMSIAKEPLIISGSISIDALFRKMKAKKVQIAFVKNAQNKITGMITLQDILDTLIEEAFEE
jgi:putative hemolysin